MSFSAENRTAGAKSTLAREVKRAAGGGPGGKDRATSSAEVAGYLADLIGELALLARERKLDNVSFLLELARAEALRAERENR